MRRVGRGREEGRKQRGGKEREKGYTQIDTNRLGL